jgi:hypothetical protein
MKLELKKVKISLSQSEETTAFTGELYIDGTKVANVSNAGRGGANRILPIDQTIASFLVRKADEFCKTLPPEIDEQVGELSMDLEFWISLEVGKIVNENEINKKQKKNILIGDTFGELVRYMKLPAIDDVLKLPDGRDYLKKIIVKVKSQLKSGEKILNKNIPNELL